MFMKSVGLGTKSDCAGNKSQQQFTGLSDNFPERV
jgi:hypothetical protein